MKTIAKYIDSYIGFLVFGGTSLVTLLLFYFLGYEHSTVFVVLTKALLTLFILYALINKKVMGHSRKSVPYLFFIFWFLWCIRVFYDYYFTPYPLRLELYRYYFFALLFCIVPFIYSNRLKDAGTLLNLRKGISIGNILFSFAIILLYYNLFKESYRLGEEDGSVSPLTVAYIGAMNISFFIWKIVLNKIRISYIILILINLPLLGLGASKGAIVASALSLIFVFAILKKLNWKILVLLIGILFIVQYSNYFALDHLIERFTYSIETNIYSNEKEVRYYLWEYSWNKFLENPFTGYFTEIRDGEIFGAEGAFYSHNIILESLLSLGIVGGGLLIAMILISLRNAIRICKYSKEDSWILLFFLVALYMNMFSGNVYSGAIWFWFFVGLINGRYSYLKRKTNFV